MIEFRQGNLLDADAEALVNTVNCVGVMGKGIALQFKQAHPANFREYERAYERGEIRLGRMFVYPTESSENPRYIINFPTKQHWKAKSRIEDIRSGLEDLVATVQEYEIKSLALPPLGCGNGGLDWSQVFPLIEGAFAYLPEVRVLVYAPQPAPVAEVMPVATKRPSMTRVRAFVILLIHRYQQPGYRLTKLEVQKLVYFLQEAGEPLGLRFVKDKFGPYAEVLNHVLRDMEGHYLRGYGDRSAQSSIATLPGAVEEAKQVFAHDPEAVSRLKRVGSLITGFENPYGMELLATAHWVAKENVFTTTDQEQAVRTFHAWSERKRETFQAGHILKAFDRLNSLNWVTATTYLRAKH